MATTSTQATPAAGQSACAPSLQSDICSTMADPHPENLPPETVCKGVRVTLDNNNMWNEFYRCRTEMILTKQGRRMFPYCRFRISGMEPFQRYILVMDITPMDNHRYKWNGRQWETNGKAEPHVLGRVFIHPDSPSSGHYWMQNPVSFYKLKLTNNTLDQEGHVILHSMHRYLPRLHVVPADKATEVIRLNGPNVLTFTFPQTEFFAVTAYQNLRITQLKIDYNPFAKGFRDEGSCSRPKPDSSEMCLELYRPTFGSEEQQTIKVNQQHLDNSDAYDSFVMDKELFPSTEFGTEMLDNGISPPKAAFRSGERQARTGHKKTHFLMSGNVLYFIETIEQKGMIFRQCFVSGAINGNTTNLCGRLHWYIVHYVVHFQLLNITNIKYRSALLKTLCSQNNICLIYTVLCKMMWLSGRANFCFSSK
uniref:T-box domain-containing protein n=1 Tax=Paramormyrops kingsleyae TaxID=1676925 RepID=A0A3B3QH23_9TELE